MTFVAIFSCYASICFDALCVLEIRYSARRHWFFLHGHLPASMKMSVQCPCDVHAGNFSVFYDKVHVRRRWRRLFSAFCQNVITRSWDSHESNQAAFGHFRQVAVCGFGGDVKLTLYVRPLKFDVVS